MSMDGLQALAAQRDQAKSRSSRHLPPPRHAFKKREASASQPAGKQSAPNSTDPATTPAIEAPSTPAPEVKETSAAPAATSDLVRATAYLLPLDDTWLSDVAQRGRQGRPRVDASRSAVIRFALERLRSEMGADEIVAELQARAARSTQSVGRKRL